MTHHQRRLREGELALGTR